MQYVLILVGLYLVISFLYSRFKKISFFHGCVDVIFGLIKVILSSGDSSLNKIEREVNQHGSAEDKDKVNQAKAANAKASSMVNNIKNQVDNSFNKND